MRRGSFLLTAAIGLFAARARAAPTDPPVVEIALVGSIDDADGVGRHIASWFTADHIAVQTTKLAKVDPAAVLEPAHHAGVRAWVVAVDSALARVFFTVEAKGDEPLRYLVTEVPLEHGLDELGVERLSQIVYLSATGLWAGNMESTRQEVVAVLEGPAPLVETPSAPSPSAPPPPPARPPPRTQVRSGLEYAARWAGDSGVTQLVGASIAVLRERGAYRIGGVFRAAALLPQMTDAAGVEVDTEGVAFALGAAANRSVGPRTHIVAQLGFGTDAVRYRAGAVKGDVLKAGGGGTDLRPLVFARAGVRTDIGPVGLAVEALLDVALVRTHYDVMLDGRRSEVLVPWRAQPGISAGASW